MRNAQTTSIVLVLILYCVTCLARPNNEELTDRDRELLSVIAAANRANRLLLNSFDCKYKFGITMPAGGSNILQDKNNREILKNGRYAFSGDKDYSRETLQDESLLHYVRNGSDHRVRSGTPLNPYDIVAIGTTSRSELRPGTPDPWAVVDAGISIQLDNLDERKHGRVVSAQEVVLNGNEYIEAAILQNFVLPNGSFSRAKITAWYSVKDGYTPVKYVYEDVSQLGMRGKGEVRKLQQFDVEGNTLYLPVEFYEETTKGRDLTRIQHYQVDVNSVRINPELPDDLFTIEIRPGDQVINKDVDVELQGPGGRDFYIDLNKEEFELPLKVPQESANPNDKPLNLCDGVQLDLVLVPQGNFVMGSPDDEIGYPPDILERLKKKSLPLRNTAEGPPHSVRVPKGFYMGKYEISCAQYRCYRPNYKNPLHKGKDDKYPAVVSWKEAVAFCVWLSDKSGMKVRLPSETEWEYACRAGTQSRFYWGESEKEAAKYANIADKSFCSKSNQDLGTHCLDTDDGYARLAPVGQFMPNTFDLYDMIGNVSEWCQDYYYEDAYRNASHHESEPKGRVCRGGSNAAGIIFARSPSRWFGSEGENRLPVGFRVVVDK